MFSDLPIIPVCSILLNLAADNHLDFRYGRCGNLTAQQRLHLSIDPSLPSCHQSATYGATIGHRSRHGASVARMHQHPVETGSLEQLQVCNCQMPTALKLSSCSWRCSCVSVMASTSFTIHACHLECPFCPVARPGACEIACPAPANRTPLFVCCSAVAPDKMSQWPPGQKFESSRAHLSGTWLVLADVPIHCQEQQVAPGPPG